MLLLAGFLLAATAIVAIGAFTAFDRANTQLTEIEHSPLVDLFLNTRDRSIDFFELVSQYDTAASVQAHLDGYLASQFQSAHQLSLDLNATLAGKATPSPRSEQVHFVTDMAGTDMYTTPSGDNLYSHDGAEMYTCAGLDPNADGTDDGLILDDDGTVIAAIVWLSVEGTGSSLEEYVVVDIPATTSPCVP